MQGLVDCSKVYVAESERGGAGAFAAVAIEAGALVERGIVRRLPAGFDGNQSPYVFTWSPDRSVWAIGSGCSTFYNCSTEPNTEMHRHYDQDAFEIFALRDIAPGEELTHVYKSLGWRSCFEDLRQP
jgi:SET domain-containing protein